MKQRPSLAFMIGAAVAVLLIVGAGVLAFLGFSSQKAMAKKLASQKRVLASMYELNPFPSMENVEQEEQNAAELDIWFQTLTSAAGGGQLSDEELSPATFATILGSKYRQLVAHAEGRTEFPEGFHVGFDRYFKEGAKLPQREHVSRLMQQVAIVDTITRTLIDSGCRSITSLVREEFETATVSAATPATSGRARRARPRAGTQKQLPADPSAGLISEGQHFARFQFLVRFDATEKATVAILNELARHDIFFVVRRLSIAKTGPDVKMPLAGLGSRDDDAGRSELLPAARATVEVPTRAERMVCGIAIESPVSVEMELDVYRFIEVAAE